MPCSKLKPQAAELAGVTTSICSLSAPFQVRTTSSVTRTSPAPCGSEGPSTEATWPSKTEVACSKACGCSIIMQLQACARSGAMARSAAARAKTAVSRIIMDG